MQALAALGLATLMAVTASTSNMNPESTTVRPMTGTWHATVTSHRGGNCIPFGIVVHQEGAGWRAEIQNADELIPVRMKVDNDSFRIDLDPYQSWIEGTIGDIGAVMHGEWIRPRGNRPTVKMAFKAKHGGTDRFPHLDAPEEIDPKVDGRWSVQFNDDTDKSVAIFETREGKLYGTFLTSLGDYRFLGGEFDGNELSVSCFDGAHAFLFQATVQDDGTLHGTFQSRDSYFDAWTGRRDSEARVPDPFQLTKVKADARWGELSYPDLEGNVRRLDDMAFSGKARILTLFGSWCPNCTDHAKYMHELQAAYGERGLSILGLAFEYDDEPTEQVARIQNWQRRLGVDHPTLLGGPADKQRAHAAFPILSAVRAYPTTIFIDGAGRIDSIHTGFSGPATGQAHVRLRDEFERRVEMLLGADKAAPKKVGSGG
jgi:thiol-disulfide isomerase/thioredoxin